MRLLLIEDDKFFHNFYARKLQEIGYTVEVASDGREGILKMRANKPDLVLLDLIMPVMDGFEVLTEKGKDVNLKAIPVLVFSTLGQEADIKRAKDLGATDYANKSFFDFDALKVKIASLLKQ